MAKEATTPEEVTPRIAPTPKEPSTPQEFTAETVIELRKGLNKIEEKLMDLPPKRENEIAYTKTQECIMWLGKSLGALGLVGPYAGSADPENPEINPRADLAEEEEEEEGEEEGGEDLDETGKTKELRKAVGKVEVQLRSSLRPQYTDNRRYQEAMQYAHKASQETMMWLGKSLEEILQSKAAEGKPDPKKRKEKEKEDKERERERAKEKEKEDKEKATKK